MEAAARKLIAASLALGIWGSSNAQLIDLPKIQPACSGPDVFKGGACVGDCFEVVATADFNPYQLVVGRRYEVESQRDASGEKILRVAEARPVWGSARRPCARSEASSSAMCH